MRSVGCFFSYQNIISPLRPENNRFLLVFAEKAEKKHL